MKLLKVIEIIIVALMVICSLLLTIWQVTQKAPIFVIVMLFLTLFFSIAALINVVKENCDKK